MIRKAFLALCAIGFLATPITAAAQSIITGNDLIAHCNDNYNNTRPTLCMGIILGFTIGFRMGETYLKTDINEDNLQYCIPDGVNNAQMRDVVIAHLMRNPAIRHRSAYHAIVESLRSAFPCRSGRSR